MMKARRRPIRTCVACRSSDEKSGLVRVVRKPDGGVCIDPTGKQPGRGAYLCRKQECVAAAAKRKGLERALGTAVPADLIEELNRVVQEIENTGC
jgi:hypothetical protein